MNCAQHTEVAASAYCRNCGKALCEVCKRDVQGTIFCEHCLASRMQAGGISERLRATTQQRKLCTAARS